MSRWLRRPPSRQQLIIFGIVAAACLMLWLLERLYGWPSALTVNGRMPRIPRHL